MQVKTKKYAELEPELIERFGVSKKDGSPDIPEWILFKLKEWDGDYIEIYKSDLWFVEKESNIIMKDFMVENDYKDIFH